jgi:SAM-dependent methyltransferase
MDEKPSPAGTEPAVTDASFDAYYFEHCCGAPYRRDEHWLTFFGGIADQISSTIQPRRVLDAGCALGILVETLRTRGIDAEGMDVSTYAIEHVYEPVRPYCRVGSIAEELPARYDLIVSIEVLEHMPARAGEAAIANLCRHTDDILFSSSPSDFRETSHVNVQPPEYWAEQFARHGFYRDVDYDASFVNAWAVRFRRRAEPLPRIVRDYERRYAALDAARQGARGYAVDVQRDLARVTAEVAARAAERDERRRALDAERASSAENRAALQHATAQLLDLASALNRERDDVRNARAALEQERNAVERDRAAAAGERKALDAVVSRLAQSESREMTSVRAALEETHAELTRKITALDALEREIDALRAEAERLRHDRDHARATIAQMERSLFWRARRGWSALSRAVGRPS